MNEPASSSPPLIPEERLWKASDVADFCGFSQAWVREHTRTGEIPHLSMPGGRVRYLPDAIREWAKSLGRHAGDVVPLRR